MSLIDRTEKWTAITTGNAWILLLKAVGLISRVMSAEPTQGLDLLNRLPVQMIIGKRLSPTYVV